MEQALTIYQFDNEYYLNRYEFLNKVQNKVLEFFTLIDKNEDFSFQGTVGDYANEIILGKVTLPNNDICLLKYNNGKLENIGCEDDTIQEGGYFIESVLLTRVMSTKMQIEILTKL